MLSLLDKNLIKNGFIIFTTRLSGNHNSYWTSFKLVEQIYLKRKFLFPGFISIYLQCFVPVKTKAAESILAWLPLQSALCYMKQCVYLKYENGWRISQNNDNNSSFPLDIWRPKQLTRFTRGKTLRHHVTFSKNRVWMFGNILATAFMTWGISENINSPNVKTQRGEKIINKEK